VIRCLYIAKNRKFCVRCPDLMSATCEAVTDDCNACTVEGCLCTLESTPQRKRAYDEWLQEIERTKHGPEYTEEEAKRLYDKIRSLGRTCIICGIPITDANKSGKCRVHVKVRL